MGTFEKSLETRQFMAFKKHYKSNIGGIHPQCLQTDKLYREKLLEILRLHDYWGCHLFFFSFFFCLVVNILVRKILHSANTSYLSLHDPPFL